MDDHHDVGHAYHPDGAAEGVQDLVASGVAQGSVAGVGDAEVAVGHQSVGNVDTCRAGVLIERVEQWWEAEEVC